VLAAGGAIALAGKLVFRPVGADRARPSAGFMPRTEQADVPHADVFADAARSTPDGQSSLRAYRAASRPIGPRRDGEPGRSILYAFLRLRLRFNRFHTEISFQREQVTAVGLPCRPGPRRAEAHSPAGEGRFQENWPIQTVKSGTREARRSRSPASERAVSCRPARKRPTKQKTVPGSRNSGEVDDVTANAQPAAWCA